MIIRKEIESDIQTIFEITKAAFESHPYSACTEPFIVGALRAANALTISLVAEVDGKVLGHAAFSPVTVSDCSPDCYGLGPISVLPGFQKRGIGKALTHEGLSLLKNMGAMGCALVGDPDNYTRFGFRNDLELTCEGVTPENVLFLPLRKDGVRGNVSFHPGFFVKG